MKLQVLFTPFVGALDISETSQNVTAFYESRKQIG